MIVTERRLKYQTVQRSDEALHYCEEMPGDTMELACNHGNGCSPLIHMSVVWFSAHEYLSVEPSYNSDFIIQITTARLRRPFVFCG